MVKEPDITEKIKSFLRKTKYYEIKLLCLVCPPIRFWRIRCWLYCIRRRFNQLNSRLAEIRGKRYEDPVDMLIGEWKADRLRTLYKVMKEVYSEKEYHIM